MCNNVEMTKRCELCASDAAMTHVHAHACDTHIGSTSAAQQPVQQEEDDEEEDEELAQMQARIAALR